MKTLYLIGGTMGVGKTTLGRELNARLPASVYLDGDWCWCMDPFTVNDETKAMVMDNICHTLNNFLRCSVLENVIFTWVMDRQEIWERLYAGLELEGCRVVARNLTCGEEALRRRLLGDVDRGLRSRDILERSAARMEGYRRLPVPLLDTTGDTPAQTADRLIAGAWEDTLILRPYRPGDCPALAELFYDTVHTVNAADYTPDQLDAWASGEVDQAAWEASFLAHHTLVAQLQGEIVGFADMAEDGYLDRLYVHRNHQGQGIATALCNALEEASQAPVFTTHASITARPFFEHRGYRVAREQQVRRRGVWLTNFVMEK